MPIDEVQSLGSESIGERLRDDIRGSCFFVVFLLFLVVLRRKRQVQPVKVCLWVRGTLAGRGFRSRAAWSPSSRSRSGTHLDGVPGCVSKTLYLPGTLPPDVIEGWGPAHRQVAMINPPFPSSRHLSRFCFVSVLRRVESWLGDSQDVRCSGSRRSLALRLVSVLAHSDPRHHLFLNAHEEQVLLLPPWWTLYSFSRLCQIPFREFRCRSSSGCSSDLTLSRGDSSF